MPSPTDGLTLIVCGGRDYPNRSNVFRVLDKVRAKQPIGLVVHGACRAHKRTDLRGADRWAEEWAKANEVPYMGIPAPWEAFRKAGTNAGAAGPARNTKMLRMVQADGVLAFPSEGTGTDDMCRKAKAAGLRVRVADDDGNLREWSESDAT
jgi:hypothetical protein